MILICCSIFLWILGPTYTLYSFFTSWHHVLVVHHIIMFFITSHQFKYNKIINRILNIQSPNTCVCAKDLIVPPSRLAHPSHTRHLHVVRKRVNNECFWSRIQLISNWLWEQLSYQNKPFIYSSWTLWRAFIEEPLGCRPGSIPNWLIYCCCCLSWHFLTSFSRLES